MRPSVLLRLLALPLVVFLTVVFRVEPAPAAGPTVQVIELNMWGLLGNDRDLRIDGYEYVLNRMDAERPLAVALSEICWEQFHWLEQKIATMGLGYVGEYERSFQRDFVSPQHSGCMTLLDPLHAEYGNAIFSLYSKTGEFRFSYSTTDPVSTRNMVCLITSAFFYVYVSCSTHLSTQATYRQPQIAQNAFVLDGASGTVFGAGDYNGDRDKIFFSPVPGPNLLSNYWEADASSPKRSTGDSGLAPIDYIFGRNDTLTRTVTAAISANLNFTDHRAVKGYYQVK